jgi:hypothetical protein
VDPKAAEVIDRLMAAAERIGMEGVRLWPDVVRITFLTSLFWAIVDPLIVAALAYGTLRLYRGAMADAVDSFDREGVRIFSALLFVCAGLIAFLALSYWPGALSGVFYPEAKTVLDLAKGLR